MFDTREIKQEVTPVFRLNKLFDREVFAKYEGGNPTGTQKDRIAEAHIVEAKTKGFRKVVAASCGNFGLALAYFGRINQMEVEIWIPSSFESPRIQEIKALGAYVKREPLTYEECVVGSSKYAEDKGFYDANPTEKTRELEYRAYGRMLDEILVSVPNVKTISCPVSNGVTLSALGHRARELNLDICFIGGSSVCNPIVKSCETGVYSDLQELFIQETGINEPLINWKSFDGENALQVILKSGGFAYGFTDEELAKEASALNKLGIDAHPSSSASVLALKRYSDFLCPAVCILTAKDY